MNASIARNPLLNLTAFAVDVLVMSNWDAKRRFSNDFWMLDRSYFGVRRKGDKIFTILAPKMTENVE